MSFESISALILGNALTSFCQTGIAYLEIMLLFIETVQAAHIMHVREITTLKESNSRIRIKLCKKLISSQICIQNWKFELSSNYEYRGLISIGISEKY